MSRKVFPVFFQAIPEKVLFLKRNVVAYSRAVFHRSSERAFIKHSEMKCRHLNNGKLHCKSNTEVESN